jgi:2-keto-4-pentenoate hydratase/2-oxohepta-3-ene-1,7-dioic acid hydratase in catechol pathway
MQDSTTDLLIYDVAALIEYLSSAMTLNMGDIIVSGTPGGVGMARNPQVFMKPGDIIEVEIEKVGSLSNPVIA